MKVIKSSISQRNIECFNPRCKEPQLLICQSSAVTFQEIPHSFLFVVFSFQASKMFWACFVQFSQNTRFCSTPAVTRGLGRRVGPWRPSCFPLNTGESAFDLSSGPECHVIFHLQLSECHEGDTLWFYQLLTCCIIFYCSTNVYISWRFPITSHIAIVVSTLMVFLGSKHCIIQIQMTWNWMDVIFEIRANKTLLFFCLNA